MTNEERRFLLAVFDGKPLPPASRNQDRARQSCKKKSWAFFDRKSGGGWQISELGKAAIVALTEEAK